MTEAGIQMLSNNELRALSRKQLKDNWGNPILASLIYFVIVCVGGAIPHVGILISIAIAGPMLLGFTHYFVKYKRNEAPKLEDVFKGFNNYVSALVLHILIGIFVLLWTLLLIVPGIIAIYKYSMAIYILNDNPDIGAKAAIDKSKEMMEGHKQRLMFLDFSFFGWFLLCLLTLGIGFLWYTPYCKLTRVHFYENLIEINNNNILKSSEDENPSDKVQV
jgi:uncharacterized membrane protein